MQVQDSNGVVWISKEEVKPSSCYGCSATGVEPACSEILDSTGCFDIIWERKEVEPSSVSLEPKYTVEEVLNVVAKLGICAIYQDQAHSIKELLIKQNDPEYQQYLALKAKFGE